MIYPVRQPLRYRVRRAWRNTWPAGTVLLLVLALCALAVWSLGCTRTNQQRALTVVAVASTKALALVNEQIRAEEAACLGGSPRFSDAQACVQKSRAKWSPALLGVDVILAAGEGALDGEPDWSAVAAAYCDMAALVPSIPPLPALLGVCR